jgi:hypothetical protein
MRAGSINLGELASVMQGDVNISTNKDRLSSVPTDYLLVRGEHVKPFHVDISSLNSDRRWINPVSVPAAYGVERIVLQGISNMGVKQRLIAGKLSTPAVVGHSCKHLIIRDGNFKIDYLLALLNSDLLNWYFKMFSTNNNVNGYELELLPIKIASASETAELEEVAQSLSGLVETSYEYSEKLSQLNSLVRLLYGLEQSEVIEE